MIWELDTSRSVNWIFFVSDEQVGFSFLLSDDDHLR